ncbi:MAG: hypothetical protein IT223_00030, partial [Crocinitomicaceae bacterium]|nr:hypothetical protein [Crocinitomicaceae bacterium]
MRKLLFFLCLTGWSFISDAQSNFVENFDPAEIRVSKISISPDPDLQASLRDTPSWQQFLNEHGTWYVHYNEVGKFPHRAYGTPIQLPQAEPQGLADTVLRNHLSMVKLPLEELVPLPLVKTEKHIWVNYRQFHNGIEVIGS